MRQVVKSQLSLTVCWPDHRLAKELRLISRFLDDHPTLAELALQDICGSKKADVGAKGMSADQVLRCAILKRIHGFSYAKLAFHLADSDSFRAFMRLGFGEEIKKSALQDNIKKLKPATWEAINKAIIGCAFEKGIESGRRVRSDSTVVQAHIHHPQDSGLLCDCVRVVTRLLAQVAAMLPEEKFVYSDHRRRAKRRHFKIVNTSRKKDRQEAYRDLLKASGKTFGYGERMVEQCRQLRLSADLRQLVGELVYYLDAMARVIDQSKRRVIDGEKVPANQKLVSIFEPHTDIIVKDRREVQFGHKVFLTGGASSLILDCVVVEGNLNDASMAQKLIERQIDLYGRAPRQASFDGGFASQDNLDAIKVMGVKDVVFSKKRGLKVDDMAKSSWVFKQLRNFRAGIEGCISTLKRVFGLNRCNWKGFESFKSYVLSGVAAYNLVILARRLLA